MRSQWHRFYASEIVAAPQLLFDLVADMPSYGRWLPRSDQYGRTTDVEPYPVQRGTRYHDGKPGEGGREWWGTVTGFQRPGSIDFQQTVRVPQMRTTVEVRIHYSIEPIEGVTVVSRWLALDVTMPAILRPLRSLITSRFERENLRTLAALKRYVEGQRDSQAVQTPQPG